jgi:hypothetical protein
MPFGFQLTAQVSDQVVEQGTGNKPLIATSHIVLRRRLDQRVAKEDRWLLVCDLLANFRDKPFGRIFQHYRLEHEGEAPLTLLQQGPSPHRLHRLHRGTSPHVLTKVCNQVRGADWLTLSCEPGQYQALHVGQAGDLNVQQSADPAEDRLALLRKGRDVAPENLADSFVHNLERQAVAAILVDKHRPGQ